MRITVMYIAIRWLRGECIRFHITILCKPVEMINDYWLFTIKAGSPLRTCEDDNIID